jgi:hypothetical protein
MRKAFKTLKQAYDAHRAGHPTVRAVDALRWAKHTLKIKALGEVAPRYTDSPNVFERGGVWVRVKLEYDTDGGPPWEDGDEGKMRDVDRYAEHPAQRNGDEYLIGDGRGGQMIWTPPKEMRVLTHAYYLRDFHGYAMQPAMEEARRRVEERRRWLERWCQDDWCYAGLVVSIYETEEDAAGDENEIAMDSLWGIDHDRDNDEYLQETANDMVSNLVDTEIERRKSEERQHKIDNRFNHAMENAL